MYFANIKEAKYITSEPQPCQVMCAGIVFAAITLGNKAINIYLEGVAVL